MADIFRQLVEGFIQGLGDVLTNLFGLSVPLKQTVIDIAKPPALDRPDADLLDELRRL